MINLLDPEKQRQIKAARLNVKLRRFVALSLVVVVSVGVVYGAGFWIASNERISAKAEHTTSETELKKYQKVVNAAKVYRQNLTTAKQILSNGMTFSSFLTDLGSTLPANTIIDSLSVSVKRTGSQSPGTIELSTRGKSYDDILKTKHAFENSKILSSVKIIRTNVPEKPAEKGIAATYPYEATFQVTINALKGAPKS